MVMRHDATIMHNSTFVKNSLKERILEGLSRASQCAGPGETQLFSFTPISRISMLAMHLECISSVIPCCFISSTIL